MYDRQMKICMQLFIQYVPKCVPIPKQSIECPWSFNDKIVSSSMSLEATICMVSNQGVSKCLAMFLNVSRAHRERYARSPESILTPIAV